MSSTGRKLPEDVWDGWKGTIRRLYLRQQLPLKSVLEYLRERGLNTSKAQLEYKLKQWRFRRNMNKEAWNFVRHKISRRERDGKKSNVILSGIQLRTETVSKETWRNGPLPSLGRVQPSPSPEPPSDLPLVVCPPVPMEFISDWPQSLPWINFQTQFQELECRNFGSNTSDSSSLVPLLPAHNIDIISVARRLSAVSLSSLEFVPDTIWNQQYLLKISAHIGLVIPESWEGENLARADILVSDSGFEQLRHILEILIATASNNIGEWWIIETNWNIFKYLLEWFLGFNSSHNVLESQTMKAFSDTLFRWAFVGSIQTLRGRREGQYSAEICYEVISRLLHAGYNPNRLRLPHNTYATQRSRLYIETMVSALQRAVEFGDKFEHIVSLFIEFGADIHAGDDNGRFSALHLVLDGYAMEYWTGRRPQVIILQRILIEKAMKDPHMKHSQILAEHAIRHGKKGLLQQLYREGFNLEFCQRVEYGLSSEVTAITCASQFCPSPQQGPWDAWLSFVLNLMSVSKRYLSNWPARLLVDPLVCAAEAGNNAAIRYFWGLGGNLDAENENGIFPLIAAAAHGRTDTCKLLLSLGADGNKAGARGLSAIHVAAMANRHEIIQLLAKTKRDKGTSLHIDDSNNVILTRLSQPPMALGAYSVLDIVIRLSPKWLREGYRESVKHLIRNGFRLSASSLRLLADFDLRILSEEKELLDILAETHLGERSSASSEAEHIDLTTMIMRYAVLTGRRNVLDKYFKDGWELEGNEIPTALVKGDIETTESILSLGVDLKTKRTGYPSFLEAAILTLDGEPILYYRELLARRPKNLAADILESTAVGIAAMGNNLQLLRDLLFVIPPSPRCLLEKLGLFGTSSRHGGQPLVYLRRHTCLRGFRFNREGHEYLNGSPLTHAVGVGLEGNFSLMLQNGYKPDELTLFRAIVCGSLEQIKFIYDSGLGDLITEGSSYHSTQKSAFPFTMSSLIQIAAYHNRTDVVQWLLVQGSTVKEWAGNRIFWKSPLQYAVEHGNLELMDILLKHGVSSNEKPGRAYEITALQLAAQKGYIGIAKILIDLESPADVNAHREPRRGMTALEGASSYGRLDMVQFLLDNGAKTEGTGQRQYIRAIKFAQINNQPEIVNILKEHRQWTHYDEELLRNERLEEPYNVHESECSDSECDFPHEWEGDDDSDDDNDDDIGLSTWDEILAEGDKTIGFLDGISTSWGEEMTLEEVEAAFISYDED
ncbi:hypothetical protein GGR58DRAFT_519644 [Xylaria digitata]|nr:hypothetical protein GGR58DRAFT_519644 [Xylaria digitata]